MKKINQKLQLKKSVIAELGKTQQRQANGGGSDPLTLLTCMCITEYPTHPCEQTVKACFQIDSLTCALTC